MESLADTKSIKVSNAFLKSKDEASVKAEASFQGNSVLPDSLLFNIPEAIVVLDEQRKIVCWNSLAEEITGWLADETIGHSIEEICYKMGMEYSFEEIEEKLKMKGVCSHELASYHKDGKYIYLDVHIKKIDYSLIQNGRYGSIIASFRDITKYKEIEHNSNKKSRVYTDIIESFSEGLLVNDFENHEFYCSKAWRIRLGINNLSYKETELAYKNLVHPDDREIIENACANLIKNRGNNLRLEYRIKTVDAGYMWILSHVRYTYNNEGKAVRDYGIYLDITERKLAEKQLIISEEKYRNILFTANEGIICADTQGKIIFANEQIAEWLGYKVEDMLGKIPSDLLFGNELIMGKKRSEERKLGVNERYDIRFRKKNGEFIWFMVSATSIFNENGDFEGYLTMFTDITKRKMLEDEIRVQKEHFETVIDNMPLPFMIFDTNGDQVLENAEMRTGKWGVGNFASLDISYKVFEVWDLNGNRVLMEDTPVYRALRGEFIKDKIFLLNYNNKQIVIEISSFPIYDKDNVLILAGVFFKDITEDFENQRLIKVQQEKLLQSKKDKIEVLNKSMKMKDEFLSLISHEFKTPITVILSAIQTMRYICKDELSEKANKYLNIIMQNSNRELKLVNNILDITRINEMHQKVNKRNIGIVSLTRSITESIKVYSAQKGSKLSLSSTFAEKVIGIDEEKYERILLNLLSNAVKYTPNGNSIEVKLFKKVVDHRCMVCIQVKDNGIGIPEDKQEHIFERFGQVDSLLSRQAEGTGLGLSLVKLLVNLLGGEITLESTVGKGSTFTVVLPACKVEESNTESVQDMKNFRLIQAIAVEFSDVYM